MEGTLVTNSAIVSLFDQDGTDIEFADAKSSSVTRAYVDDLWRVYEPIAEKGFPDRIRTRFIESFTEMFIGCHLKLRGWDIERLADGGPDLFATSERGAFLAEATAPEAGAGRGTVPPAIPDLIARDVPIAEIEFRFATAIERKAERRREHVRKQLVDVTQPAVLFVNIVRAQYGWIPHDLPVAFLLGLHETYGETTDGLPYGKGHFLRDEYRWLSAVVAARVTAWSAARDLHELVVVHNPNADIQAPEGAWGGVAAKDGNIREFTRADCAGLLRS